MEDIASAQRSLRIKRIGIHDSSRTNNPHYHSIASLSHCTTPSQIASASLRLILTHP